jgi:undecaprenyl-diphosphatase
MTRCHYPYADQPLLLSHRWLTSALLLVGLVLFTISIMSLTTHSLLYSLDQAISSYYQATDKALPGDILLFWTYLGNIASIAPLLAILYLCYRWLRKKCDDRFTMILASYGIGMLIFFLMGLAIDRQRASLPGLLKDMPFPSFPSGHMIQTLTLLVPVLYIYLPRTRSWFIRGTILFLALAYTLLIGYDRLLVNAHYLTDVLAGAGIGLFWGVFVLILFERYHLARRAANRARRVRAT